MLDRTKSGTCQGMEKCEELMNKAAQALGRLSKGVPKKISEKEKARRAVSLAAVRARRWKYCAVCKKHYGGEKCSCDEAKPE